MALSGGARACASGRELEDRVGEVLAASGFAVNSSGPRRATRQSTVGRTVYGGSLRCDWLLTGDGLGDGVAIECKYQGSPGTADEKFPYLAANIHAGRYGRPVLVVLDGGGYRRGAATWLRDQVDDEKLLAVVALAGLPVALAAL